MFCLGCAKNFPQLLSIYIKKADRNNVVNLKPHLSHNSLLITILDQNTRKT